MTRIRSTTAFVEACDLRDMNQMEKLLEGKVVINYKVQRGDEANECRVEGKKDVLAFIWRNIFGHSPDTPPSSNGVLCSLPPPPADKQGSSTFLKRVVEDFEDRSIPFTVEARCEMLQMVDRVAALERRMWWIDIEYGAQATLRGDASFKDEGGNMVVTMSRSEQRDRSFVDMVLEFDNQKEHPLITGIRVVKTMKAIRVNTDDGWVQPNAEQQAEIAAAGLHGLTTCAEGTQLVHGTVETPVSVSVGAGETKILSGGGENSIPSLRDKNP